MSFYSEEVKPLAQHYGYTLKHKWNIISPGRELGVGYGTLLKHDSDKLWDVGLARTYGKYFFGPKGVRGTNDPELYRDFRTKADKHYTRSPHHYHKINKEKPIQNKLESVADIYSLLKTTGQTDLSFDKWHATQKGKFFNPK